MFVVQIQLFSFLLHFGSSIQFSNSTSTLPKLCVKLLKYHKHILFSIWLASFCFILHVYWNLLFFHVLPAWMCVIRAKVAKKKKQKKYYWIGWRLHLVKLNNIVHRAYKRHLVTWFIRTTLIFIYQNVTIYIRKTLVNMFLLLISFRIFLAICFVCLLH